MFELILETGPERDRYVPGGVRFADIRLTDDEISVGLGPDCPESERKFSSITSHTVYELE
jgi:hypothetical protein